MTNCNNVIALPCSSLEVLRGPVLNLEHCIIADLYGVKWESSGSWGLCSIMEEVAEFGNKWDNAQCAGKLSWRFLVKKLVLPGIHQKWWDQQKKQICQPYDMITKTCFLSCFQHPRTNMQMAFPLYMYCIQGTCCKVQNTPLCCWSWQQEW